MAQLIIATRESPLALKQANWVKERLETIHSNLKVRLLSLTTAADRWSLPLAKVGGKGLFVKELEEALLDGRADIAVHSIKDMPAELPVGLSLSVVCEREDPRDVFISNRYTTLNDLPDRAVIGTSSLRRQCQLFALRPDLNLVGLRGNVNTRLKRLDEEEFAAIILAYAGLKRLGIQRPYQILTPDQILPAAGQGALGIEARFGDEEVHALILPLNHYITAACVRAERAMNKRLGGGCQVPIGAYAEFNQDKILLRGLVGSVIDRRILRAQAMDDANNAEQLGSVVAENLLSQGAEALLNS
jgi:hydroxymethylbilane synthase